MNIQKYLHTVLYREELKQFFNERMADIFQNLLYPNILINGKIKIILTLIENDVDQFETSPDNFITQDLEEADSQTSKFAPILIKFKEEDRV
jgi:hypothetical protein